MRKHNGYLFYRRLRDHLGPQPIFGQMSHKTYEEADCSRFRYKVFLRSNYYKDTMGERFAKSGIISKPSEWEHPARGSYNEEMLNGICEHAN